VAWASRPAQVEELPVISARVIEHRSQRVCCPGCGRRTRARLPGDVAASAFGPRLQAAVATLSVRNRVSRRDVAELSEELFGTRICAGTVDAILTRAANVLEEPYEDLLGRLRASESLNMDETGWPAERQPARAVGHVHRPPRRIRRRPRPARGARQTTTAGHKGIVTSDRWWAYAHLSLARRQLCWSHLKRDFQAHAEGARRRERVRRTRPASRGKGLLGVGGLPAHARPA